MLMDRIRHIMIPAAFGLAFLVASCSVKELRTDCPCYLAMDPEGFRNAGMKKVTVSVSTDSSLVNRESIELGMFTQEPYYMAVPRRMNSVSVAGGFGENSILKGDTLRVADGKMSDPLMVFTGDVACMGDNAEIRPVPHKQYCKISIFIVGKMPGDDYPYRYRINHACNGLDLRTLAPLDGRGSFALEENLQSVMECRLIRQKNMDLSIDVLREEPDGDGSSAVWKKISSIRLGAKLAQQGYDWTREDLDDVVITIDFSKADVNLEIQPWTDVFLEYDS